MRNVKESFPMNLAIKNVKIFITCLLLTATGLFIDSILPSIGIFLQPVLISIISLLITRKTTNITSIAKSTFIFMMLVIYDISVKFSNWEMHDYDWQAFVNAIYFLSSLIAFIIISFSIYKSNEKLSTKFIAVILFVMCIIFYGVFFEDFKVGENM